MSTEYSSQTFVAASAKLDVACAWLESLGINYSRTRVGRYKAIFSALARHQLAGTLSAFYDEYTFEAWVNAAHEVAEVVRMFEGLTGNSDPNLTTRLRDSLKSHELYVLDTQDRSGRDFSFELSIAAKFARYGYEIDFGHDADLKVTIGTYTFFVECKRLKSAQKMQRRIKDGLDQLHKRYVKSEDPPNSRGLLALSIGRTVNPGLGFLEGESPESIGESAFKHNAAFIERYKSYWQTKIDRRTLGVAVVLDTPGIVTRIKQVVTCHEVTMNNCISPYSPEYDLLLNVAHHVFPRRT